MAVFDYVEGEEERFAESGRDAVVGGRRPS